MAIVATYKFGKATVEIDDSCIKYTTPEEIQMEEQQAKEA